MSLSVDAVARAADPPNAPSAGVAVDGDDRPGDDGAVDRAADAFSRRSELLLLVAQSRAAEAQLRLDQLRANFNAMQERRAERMREANALRDMAIEQAKKDDEILKKYIAMI